MNQNIEHELKYTIDLSAFLMWAQPHLTRGIITTRVIRQWYIPEKLRKDGIIRIRQTLRANNDIESTELTMKVPTDNPAVRNEFNFRAMSDFNVEQFVQAFDIQQFLIEKDRWDITRALGLRFPSGARRPEAIVDFFREKDGTTIAYLEIENPPTDWSVPSFVLEDVTADMSYTNFARASAQLSPKS